MTTVVQAIRDVKRRGTAHHAHNKGKTVAFRINDNGTFDLRYDDGVHHPNLHEDDARILAETYLGPMKPPTPAKKASIPLGRGWSVALRRDEVFPDDPGNGCPAVVCGPFGKSATFNFAADTGQVLDHDHYEVDIPTSVYRRLEKQAVEDAVNEYIESVIAWMAWNERGK